MNNQQEFDKILYKVTSQTYLKAIKKATPGQGNAARAWDIEISNGSVFIVNEEFGDIITFLENGVKPHVIKAKPGKFLAFKWDNSPIKPHLPDGTFFFKKVHHPGIKARHFVMKVMNDKSVNKEWNDLMEKELEKLLSKQH